jgi:hypothetical protein
VATNDWLAIATGVTLAATCGLRAFLPLFVLGLAARFHVVGLSPAFAWLADTRTLVALGTATLLEVAGDKIPVVDHALDVAGTLLRPLAAVAVLLGLTPHVPTALAALLALAGGAGALGLHALKAKTRIGSTALSLGHANPVLSAAEDATAVSLSLAAVWVPLVALAVVALGSVLLVVLVRRRPR